MLCSHKECREQALLLLLLLPIILLLLLTTILPFSMMIIPPLLRYSSSYHKECREQAADSGVATSLTPLLGSTELVLPRHALYPLAHGGAF